MGIKFGCNIITYIVINSCCMILNTAYLFLLITVAIAKEKGRWREGNRGCIQYAIKCDGMISCVISHYRLCITKCHKQVYCKPPVQACLYSVTRDYTCTTIQAVKDFIMHPSPMKWMWAIITTPTGIWNSNQFEDTEQWKGNVQWLLGGITHMIVKDQIYDSCYNGLSIVIADYL